MKRWGTPLGPFDLELGEHGVSAVRMVDGNEPGPVDDALASSLDEHLHGRTSSLRLDLQGFTPMAQHVLAKLLEIPYAEVRSYSWVAHQIGRPRAVRAVASAVANNPIPLLIPCHRVIRSDGFIGDFSLGGSEMKRRLLTFEGLDIEYLEQLARRNVRFVGDKETATFHVPSCHKGPERDSPLLIELRSIEQAIDGNHLEPCRRCHPV